jgi:hypothetical protein
MITRHVYEYALLRVVPRVERGESVNAGVLLYCRPLEYLGSRVHLDSTRVRALDPGADIDAIGQALQSAAQMCSQGAIGPAGEEEIGRRFRWLTAPRSTVIQPGPIHTGLTNDPDGDVERLLRILVLPL